MKNEAEIKEGKTQKRKKTGEGKEEKEGRMKGKED